MPKEISSSYKGKDHKSDAPIHNVASHKKSRRYDATLSSEAYHYCLHQTRDHTSSQQEVGKPEQSMIVEKGSDTHQYAASPKREVLRLRGGADDYDDYGYGYGDPYDSGGYEDYGWHEDDAERYRDYGWHEDNEERYREDEAYGNPSDQWKKDLASTSGMSVWERDQQTEVQYEWLEEGREREAGERSKIHGDEKREEEDFEALRAEAMELIRQSEMKDEKREEEDFEALRAEAMELIRQSEMKDEKREEEDFEALRAEAMELIRQSEMKDEKREEEDFEALRAEAMELIRQSEMKDEKREEEDFEALRAEAMELIRQSEMKDEKREEEDFEALRAEAMELIRQLEMKEEEVRQHDSGEYEDQEEVGQHNGGEHDDGQGDGNGGGDGGKPVVHDDNGDEYDKNGGSDAAHLSEIERLERQLKGLPEQQDKLVSEGQEVAEETSEHIPLSSCKYSETYTPVQFEGTTKVQGEIRDISRRVYQRSDIDWDYVDKDGLTNLQRAQKGRAPIGSDGKPVELHHLTQQEPGSMVEILSTVHDKYTSQLHGLVEDGCSFRNDPVLKRQYDNFRHNYWVWRAKQL